MLLIDHRSIHYALGSVALAMATLFALTVTVSSVTVCEYHTCTPGCICDNRYDDKCAEEYGNYGWMVPKGTEDYVYKLMRPDVSNITVVVVFCVVDNVGITCLDSF